MTPGRNGNPAEPGQGGGTFAIPRRAALLGLAGCAACARLPPPATQGQPDGPAELALHVVARGWHADIGLAMAEIPGPLRRIGQDFPAATHLLFGFGERAYWTRPDRTALDALAALLPGPGVVLVTGLGVPPPVAFGTTDLVSIGLSRTAMDRLCSFLWASLERDAEDRPRPMAQGPYPGSHFYASGLVYSASYTCNTWTAEALQTAGVPVDATGILFAGQLLGRLRRMAR